MSGPVFGSEYAGQYDLLYQDKDYERECALLAEVFRRYARSPVETILDLGCGTGNHSLPLSRRGYAVTGVDRSPAMLERARQKAAAESSGGRAPVFQQGDAHDLDLGRTVDAALMMFAVLGYQLTNDDVSASLATVRRHLSPGGLFVFDVWYGPAVLAIRPGERVKSMSTPAGTVIRAASTKLDSFRQLAEVQYRVWHLGQPGPPQETVETHPMRYFFPQELALFLTHARFRLRHFCEFGALDHAPDETTWNVLAIAEAVE
jgi:SAM-dependent methyltransferase